MTPARAGPLWAVGQVGAQIFRDVPSLLLLFYMTQVLNIPPALAGSAIFVPKLFWAVLCDWGVGAASDKWRARFARRHFLLLGALLAPIAMILLFTPPETGADAGGKALHVALMLALYMASFALFSVPHLAIGAELATADAGRSRVMGWKMAFAGIGLLIGGSAAPILLQRWGGDAAAYMSVAVLLAGISAASLVIAWFGSAEPAGLPQAAVRGGATDRGALRAALANRRFVALFSAMVLQLTASGLAYACFAYLFSYNLAFPRPLETVGIVVLIVSACVILVQPFWVWAADRFGKRATFLTGTVGYAASILAFLYVPPGEAGWAYGAAVVMGVFNSACYLSIFAMLGDVVAEEGSDRAGTFSALMVAGDKIAFALGGTLIAGAVLGAFGFVAGGTATQSEEALTGIAIAYAWLPVAFNAAAFWVVWRGYDNRRRPGPQPV
jgi:glycoside/pentoside/hexuronide:cation symporter, GPH family